MNIMSQDVNQLQQFMFPYVQQLVTGPATIVACLVLLWFQIKWTTFLALAMLVITLVASGACVGRLMLFRRDMLREGDLVGGAGGGRHAAVQRGGLWGDRLLGVGPRSFSPVSDKASGGGVWLWVQHMSRCPATGECRPPRP